MKGLSIKGVHAQLRKDLPPSIYARISPLVRVDNFQKNYISMQQRLDSIFEEPHCLQWIIFPPTVDVFHGQSLAYFICTKNERFPASLMKAMSITHT